MAGRYKEPVDALIAKGKTHLTQAEIDKRRAAEATVTPATDKIKCPNWLDKEGKKEWKRICVELTNLKLMTNVDVVALAIYCDAYSKYITATRNIQEQGVTVKYTNAGGATNDRPNPNIEIANKYAQLVKSFCSQFGLTPVARVRLIAPKVEGPKSSFDDDFDEDDDD